MLRIVCNILLPRSLLNNLPVLPENFDLVAVVSPEVIVCLLRDWRALRSRRTFPTSSKRFVRVNAARLMASPQCV
jgi:hypothetical protein